MKTKETDECGNVGRGVSHYKIYGLTLGANQPLPGLVPTSTSAPVDVWVELAEDGQSQLPPLVQDEAVEYRSGWQTQQKADSTYFHLWFRSYGTLDFEISSSGNQITASWTYALLEEVTGILLGPVLGCVLRLRGTICLHASVVAVGQRAIAIIGSKGAGKSTTAAALAQRGQPILSDDIAVLTDSRESFLVQPGYPRLRLWPESVNALYGSEVGLNRVLSDFEKRFVNLTAHSSALTWRFQQAPLPLAAIYVLEKRQPWLASPSIESIPPTIGLMTLMAHRSASFLKLEPDRQAQEFARLSRLATTVPIRQVHRPDNLTQLPELCEAILEDARSLTCSFCETDLS